MSILGSTMEITVGVTVPDGETVSQVTVSIIDPDGDEIVLDDIADSNEGGWVYYWQSPEDGTPGDYTILSKAICGVNIGKATSTLTMTEL